MDHEGFVREVQQRAGLDSYGEAENAVRAVLQTLAERLAGGEVEDLASQLPQSVAGYLQHERVGYGEAYSLDEFYYRVAERGNASIETATSHVRAVFAVIEESVTSKEASDIRAQLPNEYESLFGQG